jgi:hypothetical protein
MIEVFKTNVLEISQSKALVEKLIEHIPSSRINFDLQDCDKILRVEAEHIIPEKIIEVINSNGYQCQVLE